MNQIPLPIIDPNESPAGFYAVPKSALRHDQGNLCRQCDWRKVCGDPGTDLSLPGHQCMSHRRKDGCGAAFKRLKSAKPKRQK